MFRPVVSLSIVAFFAFSAISAWADDTAPKPPALPISPTMASIPDAELVTRVVALEKEVADLKRERKELVDIVNNHSTMLRDVVSDRQSPSGGKYFVPNVQAIRDDSDSRRKLVDTVVHDMTRTSGELRIHNEMGTGQSLVINGVDTVYVAPHSSRNVTVASGTATTELPGEGLKSWMIGAPGYYQDIVVAPAVPRTNGSAWQYDPLTGIWSRTVQ